MAPKVKSDSLKYPARNNCQLNQAKTVTQESSILYDKRQIIICHKNNTVVFSKYPKLSKLTLTTAESYMYNCKNSCASWHDCLLSKKVIGREFFYIKKVIKEHLKCQKK